MGHFLDLINPLVNWIATFLAALFVALNIGLSQKWWQGLAGIAQLGAAGFSAFAVWQASKMISDARKERLENRGARWAIAPSTATISHPQPDVAKWRSIVILRNIGTGPGIDVWAEAYPRPSLIFHIDPNKTVAPGGSLTCQLDWSEPAAGRIDVRSFTQLGLELHYRFQVRCTIADDGNPASLIEAWPDMHIG